MLLAHSLTLLNGILAASIQPLHFQRDNDMSRAESGIPVQIINKDDTFQLPDASRSIMVYAHLFPNLWLVPAASDEQADFVLTDGMMAVSAPLEAIPELCLVANVEHWFIIQEDCADKVTAEAQIHLSTVSEGCT